MSDIGNAISGVSSVAHHISGIKYQKIRDAERIISEIRSQSNESKVNTEMTPLATNINNSGLPYSFVKTGIDVENLSE